MTFKVLDLFSGIGGFSLALDQIEHNGEKVFETVAFCEIDKDCHTVLNKHWPDVPIFEDVTKVAVHKNKVFGDCFLHENKDEFTVARGGKSLRVNFDETTLNSKIDVIVGGFPCQDISTAGKQRGLKDEDRIRELIEQGHSREDAEKEARTRSGLWDEYKRLIEEIRPRWVIIENVPNLLNLGLNRVLSDLDAIGFSASWEIISARSVGSVHLRKRVWIIAYPNCESVRNGTEWDEVRRLNLQDEREAIVRHISEVGRVGEVHSSSLSHPAYSDDFRFWPSFASEEEKQLWWAKATFSIRSWWEAVPSIRRMDDAISEGLDRGSFTEKEYEDARKARIKQLGNSIVPGIASIIGERIKFHEFNEVSAL